jgi:hypothetical protein
MCSGEKWPVSSASRDAIWCSLGHAKEGVIIRQDCPEQLDEKASKVAIRPRTDSFFHAVENPPPHPNPPPVGAREIISHVTRFRVQSAKVSFGEIFPCGAARRASPAQRRAFQYTAGPAVGTIRYIPPERVEASGSTNCAEPLSTVLVQTDVQWMKSVENCREKFIPFVAGNETCTV